MPGSCETGCVYLHDESSCTVCGRCEPLEGTEAGSTPLLFNGSVIMSNTQRRLDFLKEVRQILTEPSAWIKGRYAQDTEGLPANPAKASCYCLSGAIFKVIGAVPDGDSEMHDNIVLAMFPRGHGGSAIEFNDAPARTHAEVLAKIDEGIHRLEALV